MGKTNSRLTFLTINMIYRHILKTFHFFYVFNHKNMTGPCIFAVGTGFSPHTLSLLLTPLPGFMIHSLLYKIHPAIVEEQSGQLTFEKR